jgi:hypothetical protein
VKDNPRRVETPSADHDRGTEMLLLAAMEMDAARPHGCDSCRATILRLIGMLRSR